MHYNMKCANLSTEFVNLALNPLRWLKKFRVYIEEM